MRKKQFDCVQMKWEIQQQIEKELAELSDKEAYKVKIEKVLKNSMLGAFLNRLYSARQVA